MPKPAERKGLSTGCIIALVPAVLGGLCLLVPIVYMLGSVTMMNVNRADFDAFDRVAPGTSVSDVAKRAEDLGFAREPGFQVSDGGVENITYEKVVVPPFGRWFINISAIDGGVISVHTSSLD
jgi:hypothetical protein